MPEKIYTIPVNEAFEERGVCPVCTIFDKLEKNEVERILGAAMMEPDVRIETNKHGFCHKHFEKMFTSKNRLSLALMLESHIDEINKTLFSSGIKSLFKKNSDYLSNLLDSCYICNRIDMYMDKMLESLFYLYKNESKFRDNFRAQSLFCLKHYNTLLKEGQKRLSKKDYDEFYKTISGIENSAMDKLAEDIKWFCKKFDYRFTDEPWKDSKDAVERSIYMLTGDKKSQ